MKDLGLLTIRLVAGTLMAGHGAQKLFGWFGGHGPQGTGGWMESMGLRPGKPWALMAGGSEFGSGVITALGLASPLGPVGILAPMAVAAGTVHRGKPIWATEGGAELPALYAAVGAGLALTGPGRYSLDRALGLRVPVAFGLLAVAGVAAGVAMTLRQSAAGTAPAETAPDQAAEEATEPESTAAAEEASVELHVGEDSGLALATAR